MRPPLTLTPRMSHMLTTVWSWSETTHRPPRIYAVLPNPHKGTVRGLYARSLVDRMTTEGMGDPELNDDGIAVARSLMEADPYSGPAADIIALPAVPADTGQPIRIGDVVEFLCQPRDYGASSRLVQARVEYITARSLTARCSTGIRHRITRAEARRRALRRVLASEHRPRIPGAVQFAYERGVRAWAVWIPDHEHARDPLAALRAAEYVNGPEVEVIATADRSAYMPGTGRHGWVVRPARAGDPVGPVGHLSTVRTIMRRMIGDHLGRTERGWSIREW